MKNYDVVSFFAGCGGLDVGFSQAGFNIVWANEYDKTIWDTYELNHKNTFLDKRSVLDVPYQDVPSCVGIIGGPPCQSWSLAGAMRGASDPRGKLFYEYIRIIDDKKPLFFLAENVPGMLSKTHVDSFYRLLREFEQIGYIVDFKLLNAVNYGVPQERKRVIIVGYSEKIGKSFSFPEITHDNINSKNDLFSFNLKPIVTLKDAIGDLPLPFPAIEKNKANPISVLTLPNHEYMTGGFSTIYLSRNRKKEWDQPSFTIQAGGRHAPLHPQAPKMIKLEKDWWKFDESDLNSYRRLSVRECAIIQTFPDDFIFLYNSIANGYKMIGNAVPVKLSNVIAEHIYKDINTYFSK